MVYVNQSPVVYTFDIELANVAQKTTWIWEDYRI